MQPISAENKSLSQYEIGRKVGEQTKEKQISNRISTLFCWVFGIYWVLYIIGLEISGLFLGVSIGLFCAACISSNS